MSKKVLKQKNGKIRVYHTPTYFTEYPSLAFYESSDDYSFNNPIIEVELFDNGDFSGGGSTGSFDSSSNNSDSYDSGSSDCGSSD